MKLLLTGKNGQVGFELERSLAALGELVAVDVEQCDLADAAAVRRIMLEVKPDLVVNPAAYTAVDSAEQHRDVAYAINAVAPEVIGSVAKQIGAAVIHFSTDYVFSGSKDGPYVETDDTGPLGVYGASKLAGELALAASGARHLILRTSWVIGAHGNNFAKTMLRLAKERDTLRVVADQHGAPTSAALLADVAAHLVHRGAYRDVADGVYHVTNQGEATWHEVACFVVAMARSSGVAVRVDAANIAPISTAEYPTPAKRPANSRLDGRKFAAAFGLELPHWQTSLTHTLRQILRP